MSKNAKKYSIAALRARKQEAGVDVLPIEAPDGTMFRIPAPGFFPDEAYVALREKDSLRLAEALFGTEYPAYVAAGGQADDLGLVLEEWGVEQGVELPKS